MYSFVFNSKFFHVFFYLNQSHYTYVMYNKLIWMKNMTTLLRYLKIILPYAFFVFNGYLTQKLKSQIESYKNVALNILDFTVD